MYSWAFCQCSLNEIVLKYGRNGLSMKYGLLSTKCIAYSATGIRRCWMRLQQSRFYFFCVLDVPSDKEREKSWDAFKPLKLLVAAQEIYFSTTIHIWIYYMRLLANVHKSLHFLYLRDFLSKSCPPKIRQIALMQLFQHNKPTKLTFIMGRPAREKARYGH